MRSEKRRDWYDEIYDTYVSMHLRGDDANIVEWTPFGRNSIDITFRDGRAMFNGCIVLKTDPTDTQGIPDLLVLYRDKWASLECKRNRNASRRPNQEYYVDKMNDMSFSRFVYPENKEEVLNELREVFEPCR